MKSRTSSVVTIFLLKTTGVFLYISRLGWCFAKWVSVVLIRTKQSPFLHSIEQAPFSLDRRNAGSYLRCLQLERVQVIFPTNLGCVLLFSSLSIRRLASHLLIASRLQAETGFKFVLSLFEKQFSFVGNFWSPGQSEQS